MNISQRDLANAIHAPYQRVNQKRGVTPSTALRVVEFFGVPVGFWLTLQVRWDLFKAQKAEKKEIPIIGG
ncbi:MAG: addiction module antidote protein, HigA family [Candidatus Sedimenticola sp. (ex Thyasira tokunagai)]